MELEFDKEIDAILRRARSGMSASVATADHLDADMVAAFAENALPDKAKMLCIEHFADCVRCRKQLSFVMQINAGLEPAAVSTPAVAEPAIESSIPWYKSLFQTPNLAFAMGALILVFGGFLGYLALQQQGLQQSATVTQVTDSEQSLDAPSLGGGGGGFNEGAPLEALIATANPTAPSSNMSANSAAARPETRSDAPAEKLAAGAHTNTTRSGQFQVDGASSSENNYILDGQEITDAKPPAKSAAAPPPPAMTDATSGVAAERDEKKADDAKFKEESKDVDLAKRKQVAAKSVASRAGPAQSQLNQMNSNMPVTRVVGGKTFNNLDGAWYDSAYRNQATIDLRRGTDEYKKLDAGLRNIADTLGGTVVVVWKSKAYRIQ